MDEKVKYGENNYCPFCFKPHSEGCDCMTKLYGVMKNNTFTPLSKPKKKKKK